ncbi:hypothetical protein RchiOBHm_Chr5g0063641 [Rosa chinensis]|uniref:Uncharacterized protein n=1 Tax=Rosa chinensis TaxID=74649 RepID=A0A2P6QIH0_ROSCH|nr:hypothetical protein RchiOBHm_Chr5g0063641 [Rosa chinensis]
MLVIAILTSIHQFGTTAYQERKNCRSCFTKDLCNGQGWTNFTCGKLNFKFSTWM